MGADQRIQIFVRYPSNSLINIAADYRVARLDNLDSDLIEEVCYGQLNVSIKIDARRLLIF